MSESTNAGGRVRLTLDLSNKLNEEVERLAAANGVTKDDVLRFARELLAKKADPALSAHSTGSGGVAAEPVAGWKLVPVEPTSEMRKACWTGLGIAESRRAEFEQSGVHYFAKMIAAAPTPPAGGGETEAHPICDRPTLYDRGECCGKTPCASPASPAGDLISLSAGAQLGQELLSWHDAIAGRFPMHHPVSDVIRRAANVLKAAPAKSRKGPSEEEIARIIDPWAFTTGGEGFNREAYLDAERQDRMPIARRKAEAILALLIPADRGETQAVRDGWPASYQATFNAIAAATRITPGGTSIGISVADFYAALAAAPPPDQNRGEPDQGGANTEAGR